MKNIFSKDDLSQLTEDPKGTVFRSHY